MIFIFLTFFPQETFNVPALYVCPSDEAALFSVIVKQRDVGKTACVLHSGFDSTVVSCVVDGETVPHSIVTAPVGGAHVSLEILKRDHLLAGVDNWEARPTELLDEIKAKLCFVAPSGIASVRSAYQKDPLKPVKEVFFFFFHLFQPLCF